MRFLALSLALLLGPALPRVARAGEAVIITTEGTIIRVVDYKTLDDNILYDVRKLDEQQTLPVAQVEAIIDRASMALEYTEDQVDSVLAEMDRVGQKYPEAARAYARYRKEYTVIKERFAKAAANLDKHRAAIDMLVADYTYSARDPETYTKVQMDLDLIAMEDMNGVYREEIATLKERLKANFLKLNLARLGQMTAAVDATGKIPDYVTLRDLAAALELVQPGRPIVGQIHAMRDHALSVTIRKNLAAARAGIGGQPSIDDYLRLNTQLGQLRSLATKDDLRDEVDTLALQLAEAVTQANPDYQLTAIGFEGFPMTRDDLMTTSSYGHTLTYINSGTSTRYPALAFLTADPSSHYYKDTIALKLRVIFRATPPSAEDYRLAFYYDHEPLVTAPLQRIAVSHGHGNGYVEVSFADLPAKTLKKLQADADEADDLLIYAQVESRGSDGKGYHPVTAQMTFRLNLGAEPPQKVIIMPD